jgi:microcystin-dependent protein
LSFDGTLTAETSIIIPSANKMYYVRNNTSGSFALKIKTAGNTAITVNQGTNVMVASDGTDVYQTAIPTSVSSFTANNFTATSVSTNVLNATKVSTSIMTAAQVSATAIHATSVSAVSGRFSGTVSASAFAGLGIIPTGMISPYAGGSAPTGFLLCFGQAVSRSTYSDLFAVVSATYGAGDGSSTFNVPDLRGRVVAGQDDMGGSSANRLTAAVSGGVNGDTLGGSGGLETKTLTIDNLPDTHHYKVSAGINDVASGASGARANPLDQGGGEAINIVQPTFILNYIIKT